MTSSIDLPSCAGQILRSTRLVLLCRSSLSFYNPFPASHALLDLSTKATKLIGTFRTSAVPDFVDIHSLIFYDMPGRSRRGEGKAIDTSSRYALTFDETARTTYAQGSLLVLTGRRSLPFLQCRYGPIADRNDGIADPHANRCRHSARRSPSMCLCACVGH